MLAGHDKETPVSAGFSFHDASDLAAYAAFVGAGLGFGWTLLKNLTTKVTDLVK